MGGPGSGNWWRRDKKTTVENCRCLDINRMVKLGAIPKNGRRSGLWVWRDAETDEATSTIGYEADTLSKATPFLRLQYTLTDRQRKIDYKIELSPTQAHYGGRRFWFVCPTTHKRVTKLYLPGGGDIFASRHASEDI